MFTWTNGHAATRAVARCCVSFSSSRISRLTNPRFDRLVRGAVVVCVPVFLTLHKYVIISSFHSPPTYLRVVAAFMVLISLTFGFLAIYLKLEKRLRRRRMLHVCTRLRRQWCVCLVFFSSFVTRTAGWLCVCLCFYGHRAYYAAYLLRAVAAHSPRHPSQTSTGRSISRLCGHEWRTIDRSDLLRFAFCLAVCFMVVRKGTQTMITSDLCGLDWLMDETDGAF